MQGDPRWNAAINICKSKGDIFSTRLKMFIFFIFSSFSEKCIQGVPRWNTIIDTWKSKIFWLCFLGLIFEFFGNPHIWGCSLALIRWWPSSQICDSLCQLIYGVFLILGHFGLTSVLLQILDCFRAIRYDTDSSCLSVAYMDRPFPNDIERFNLGSDKKL